jgi:hypothetical protein
MASLNPQIGDVFYIGTLAANLTDALRTGQCDKRAQEAAAGLHQLIELAIAFRTGNLSVERKKTPLSPADAFSLFVEALLQMPLSSPDAPRLEYFSNLLSACAEGRRVDKREQDDLATFLAHVSRASASVAQGVAAALNRGLRGGTPWAHG